MHLSQMEQISQFDNYEDPQQEDDSAMPVARHGVASTHNAHVPSNNMSFGSADKKKQSHNKFL
jgi:hypothetical protein